MKTFLLFLAVIFALKCNAQVLNTEFVVIDAMKSKKSEDLIKYNLHPLNLVYTVKIWPGTKSNSERQNLPKQETIEAISRDIAPNSLPLVCLDIEHLRLDIRRTVFKDADDILSGNVSQIRESMDKMIQILNWAKTANPSAKFGYYSCVPIRDYFTPVNNNPAKVKDWQAANDLIMPLADASDALFPSLYTFYPDRKKWIAYAKGMIAETKRIAKGKPIYVYVWPRYHQSNKELANTYIDGEFWRLQLETIYAEGVQGIVLWDGSKFKWEPETEWWKETLDFMKSKGIR